jgi:small subunit ribosomal protein S16
MGAKKAPVYRLVVANSTDSRDGRFIETIGFYDPTTKPATVRVKEDRAKYWLSVGAQPSDTARNLLTQQGVIENKAAAAPAETPAG